MLGITPFLSSSFNQTCYAFGTKFWFLSTSQQQLLQVLSACKGLEFAVAQRLLHKAEACDATQIITRISIPGNFKRL